MECAHFGRSTIPINNKSLITKNQRLFLLVLLKKIQKIPLFDHRAQNCMLNFLRILQFEIPAKKVLGDIGMCRKIFRLSS